jgi:tetratricopeptide (TPR) repeat protein
MRLARLARLALLAAGLAHCAPGRPPAAPPAGPGGAPAAVAAADGRRPPAAPADELRPIGDGLYVLYYEGSTAKSTVVEGDDALALVEAPASDRGGDARHLTEHREAGERALRALGRRFPGKPVKYLLSTHWHPHSVSTLAPFVERGAKLVTTRANFERLGEMLEPAARARAADWAQFVDGDALELGRGRARVVALRFERARYPGTPTDDYLFFYLPAHDALHVGCMYNKWEGPPVAGRELLTRREVDLHQFLRDRGLRPARLIRSKRETATPGEALPAEGLERVVREGVSTAELAARYERLGAADVRARRPALVREAVADNLPASVFNQLAYDDLRRGDLDRALEFATLQALLAPDDPNAWDTLGQVHYALGDRPTARAYERAVKRMAPAFDGGGEATWQAELEALRRARAAPPPAAPPRAAPPRP